MNRSRTVALYLLGAALAALPLLFLLLFYVYPLFSIFQLSFARGEGLLRSLLTALTAQSTQRVLIFTFWQATLSTLGAATLGLPAAYITARYQFAGRSLFRALTAVPFVMPTLVVAAAFDTLIGASGWINQILMAVFNLAVPPLHLTNSLTAIVLAHIFYNTTIFIRTVGDFAARIDPHLAAAACTLGASRWRAFWHVSLPLLMPAIIAAALLVFLFNFTSFGVVLTLGGPRFATLEVEIYRQVTGLFNLPMAAALSIIQLLCTLLLTVIYTRLAARLSRPLGLQSPQRTQTPLRSHRARVLTFGVLAATAALLILPLFSLAARSFFSLEHGRDRTALQSGFTLQFYAALFTQDRPGIVQTSPQRAILVSLAYAAATVALSLLLGLPTAWTLARAPLPRLTALLDPLLMLPIGTSAVTLGLGFIVALDTPPLDLRASPLLIPLAHTLVAFPFVVRSLTPALNSIQPRLRHAAATLGANPLQVIATIDLPLTARAVLVAAVFAFTISLGEFGATALLARPEYPTIPTLIYRYLSRPGGLNYGQALALSALLMLVCTIGILFIERFRLGEGGEF
ncbi:MAG: iron ABC transporter permease [Anaerolineales bacterium]